MITEVLLYGDSGLMCNFGNKVTPQVNDAVLFVNNQIQQLTGILYTVPTYNKLVVYFDKTQVSTSLVIDTIQQIKIPANLSSGKVHDIPVCYDLEFGLDLVKISEHIGLSIKQTVESHYSKPLYMYGYGFLPGMPKYGDTTYCAPRRLEKPRSSVPSGSLGWVEYYGSAYTKESPGGWNIVGRTPIQFFDKSKQSPCLIDPGDWIQFYPITLKEFYAWN